jgi:hypothetical protein
MTGLRTTYIVMYMYMSHHSPGISLNPTLPPVPTRPPSLCIFFSPPFPLPGGPPIPPADVPSSQLSPPPFPAHFPSTIPLSSHPHSRCSALRSPSHPPFLSHHTPQPLLYAYVVARCGSFSGATCADAYDRQYVLTGYTWVGGTDALHSCGTNPLIQEAHRLDLGFGPQVLGRSHALRSGHHAKGQRFGPCKGCRVHQCP